MAKCQIHNNFLANVATHFLVTAVIFLPPGIEPTLLALHLFEGPLWGRFTDWAIETAAQTVITWSASLCSAATVLENFFNFYFFNYSKFFLGRRPKSLFKKDRNFRDI